MLGPPVAPGKHLSGPETHPTPGQGTRLPGHCPIIGAPPPEKKRNQRTTTPTATPTQRGIFLGKENFFIVLGGEEIYGLADCVD